MKIRLNSQTPATPSPDLSAACVQSPKWQRRAISNKMITPKLCAFIAIIDAAPGPVTRPASYTETLPGLGGAEIECSLK